MMLYTYNDLTLPWEKNKIKQKQQQNQLPELFFFLRYTIKSLKNIFSIFSHIKTQGKYAGKYPLSLFFLNILLFLQFLTQNILIIKTIVITFICQPKVDPNLALRKRKRNKERKEKELQGP